jgi:hypothetical protein
MKNDSGSVMPGPSRSEVKFPFRSPAIARQDQPEKNWQMGAGQNSW